MSGKFIVIEGLEAAGKTQVCQTVVNRLRRLKPALEIISTREPGGTPLAEQLRTLVKQGIDGEVLTSQAEVLMLYAARAQLVENTIKPALAHGAWVVGDRHDLSSQAYQGGGRGVDAKLMTLLRDRVLGGFRPDLTLYLDIPVPVSLERVGIRGRPDRIEQESPDFFERTRKRYLELARKDKSIQIIDASQAPESVNAAVGVVVDNWLNNQSVK